MTKKEWNKLKLQIVLGKKPKHTLICNLAKDCFCIDCKYDEKGCYQVHGENVYHSPIDGENSKGCSTQKDCYMKIIETLDEEKEVNMYGWATRFCPKRFDDDQKRME